MSTALCLNPAELFPPRWSAGWVYPFSAIVGQDGMKLALILNAIEPRIGGVLIRGEKGTAKSTAVRALAALLPHHPVHGGCVFACDPRRPEEWCPACRARGEGKTRQGSGDALADPSPPPLRISKLPRPVAHTRRVPVVTLPLNATEDMVLGGLDFSLTIRRGSCVFQPGLLARVHRGILYVDEVNLLDDHLVDVILDAAASGENVVEREGVAFRHATRFALVGTMNPEEGSLRPQLLDRFGLCVEVTSERDPDMRVELVERRERFELDYERFCRQFAQEEAHLASRLVRAQDLLPLVRTASHIRKYIGELTRSQNVAGHRADLVIERASCAHSAWNGRTKVLIDDVLEVAEMALVHRRRDAIPPPPPPQPPVEDDEEQEEQNRDEADSKSRPPELSPERNQTPPPSGVDSEMESSRMPPPSGASPPDRLFQVGATFSVKKLAPPDDRLMRRGSGRRSRTRTYQKQGRYVRARMNGEGLDPALDATLRAAAPHQAKRRGERVCSTTVIIRRQDWREKVREKRIGCFLLFVVDASGSMGARGRMAASKGAILSLLLDAYQKRDRVGMISFRRREAQVLLPPTASIEMAASLLRELPVGGRTPLSAGLNQAYRLLQSQLRRDPNLRPLGILITDGKSNVSISGDSSMDETLRLAARMGKDRRTHWIVVDTEEPGIVRFELARRIAAALGAEYFRIDGLRAADLVNVVTTSVYGRAHRPIHDTEGIR